MASAPGTAKDHLLRRNDSPLGYGSILEVIFPPEFTSKNGVSRPTCRVNSGPGIRAPPQATRQNLGQELSFRVLRSFSSLTDVVLRAPWKPDKLTFPRLSRRAVKLRSASQKAGGQYGSTPWAGC